MDQRQAAAHIERLEQQLQAAQESEASYANEIERLRNDMETRLAMVLSSEPQPTAKVVEPAPPEIMSELSRTRIRCAQTERQVRQLERSLTSQQEDYRSLVAKHEQQQRQVERAQNIRQERDDLALELARVQTELRGWWEVQKGLRTLFSSSDTLEATTDIPTSGPPEMATLKRLVQEEQSQRAAAEQRAARFQTERDTARSQLEQERASYQGDKEEARESAARERANKIRIQSLESRLAAAEQQAQLFQRESQSLTTLMESFEVQMEKKGIATPSGGGPSVEALRVQLETSQTEGAKWRDLHAKITTELTESKSSLASKSAELDVVKEKFGKLRDALMAEREKVAKSEARAVQAEELAGKGSFDPSKTRVLHLSETPLVLALKDEVAVLKRQVEAGGGVASGVNPEKLNQRLKEHFKEQIALFREGVYLMTGFKIDMLPDSNDKKKKPKFRLRSVFAEQEEDHLMLQWPQTEGPVASLDILDTEFAKILAKTPSYAYMTTTHSLPAFLASVQLSLFDKQTVS